MDSDTRTEFERAVVEHLQITASVAKIASQRLLEEIKLKGALEHVRLELAGVRLHTIELNPPFFQAMLNRNRLDLTLEAFVLRAEWRPLFSEQQLQVARRRLKEHGYAPEMQGRSPSLDLQPARPTKCLLTRTAKLIYFSMLEEALPNQIRRIEDSLATGRFGYPNPEHRAFLEDTTDAALEFPNAVRQYRLFDLQFFETTIGLLSALETALDLSDERIQGFLLRDLSDPREYDVRLLEKPASQRSVEEEAEVEDIQFAMQGERELLIWRAVRLAHFIGEQMKQYVETHRFEEDRWSNWRQGRGSKAISDFVSGLGDQNFQLLLTCQEIEAMLVLPSGRRDDAWLTLPSDGDLVPVAGALHVENAPDYYEWQELLGNIPEQIRPGNILRAAWLAADRTGQPERVERLRADRDTTSEVLDKVESIIAFQKAELDLLEGMKNPGTISRARAEEMLKDMLGSVYNRLCHDARHALMSAEQVFRYPDFASAGDTIFNIAKAFEVQLKEVVLPLLAEYLTALGIKTFPRKIKPKGRPIIGDGVLDKNRSLGHIKEALNCADPELVEFCKEHGLDLMKLRESIEQILPYRNRTGHGEALTLPKVTELRERWLGVDVRDGGIFRFVITDRFDPRLVRF